MAECECVSCVSLTEEGLHAHSGPTDMAPTVCWVGSPSIADGVPSYPGEPVWHRRTSSVFGEGRGPSLQEDVGCDGGDPVLTSTL